MRSGAWCRSRRAPSGSTRKTASGRRRRASRSPSTRRSARAPTPSILLGGAPVDGTTQTETGDDAVGGFADVTPGRPTVSATLASNGEVYARFTAYVRANSLTVVWLQPTPLE